MENKVKHQQAGQSNHFTIHLNVPVELLLVAEKESCNWSKDCNEYTMTIDRPLHYPLNYTILIHSHQLTGTSQCKLIQRYPTTRLNCIFQTSAAVVWSSAPHTAAQPSRAFSRGNHRYTLLAFWLFSKACSVQSRLSSLLQLANSYKSQPGLPFLSFHCFSLRLISRDNLTTPT